MLIASSPQEFSYIDKVSSPLVFILNSAAQAFGLCFLYPFLIYLLFPVKIKKALSLAALIFAFSAVCNIFIFPGQYGAISSHLVFAGSVNHNLREILINLSVLALVLAVCIIGYSRGFKKPLSFLGIVIFAALFSFSTKNIYSISREFIRLSEYYSPGQKNDETIESIFHFSKTGKNIFVIMLDMADSVFIPHVFAEGPELWEQYDGFVYYPNTVTFNGFTKGGAPPIFGGYEYSPMELNERPDVPLKEKTNEALFLMPRLFAEKGFSVTITDPPYADDNWIPDLRIYGDNAAISAYITDGAYTDLWLKRNNIHLPPQSAVLKRNILWYAIFRELPFAFRIGVYALGGWCAPFSEHRMRLMLNGYSVLDFLDELTDFESEAENQAVIMTNNATHENSFLQAPEYRPQLNVTNFGTSAFGKEVWYHVNAGALKRLSEYFDFLKAHDIYDNTRIILVSDHGVLDSTYVTKTSLPFAVDQFNPLLMVKDFGSRGAVKTDMTFMSNADVPVLAMNEIIENPVNPFTGNPITTENKKDPLPILIKRVQEKNEFLIELNPQNIFFVHDSIFDEKNWVRADRYGGQPGISPRE